MGGGKGASPAPTVLPAAAPEEDTSWLGQLSKIGVTPNPPSMRGGDSHRLKAENELTLNNSLSKIDTLWGRRMTAEESAISSVDAQLAKEQTDANVLGVDYAVADEDRIRRIEAAFSDQWKETDESSLFDLVKKYGNPEQPESIRRLIQEGKERYSWEYDVNFTGKGPGLAPTSAPTIPGTNNTRTTRQTVLTNSDDDELGSRSLLGG